MLRWEVACWALWDRGGSGVTADQPWGRAWLSGLLAALGRPLVSTGAE